MENKMVVYVAGNPNAYPLEYYNPQTKCFEGAIPELFHSFSQNSKYQIEYYDAGSIDHREHLAKNLQVDLISGYQKDDLMPAYVQELEIAAFNQNNQQKTVRIGFTDAAPEAFVTEFEAFTQSVSAETLCGLLVDAVERPTQSALSSLKIAGIAVTAVLIIVVLLRKIKKHKRHIEQLEQKVNIDPDTGLGNRTYLKKMFFDKTNGPNRMLYSIVYIQIHTTPRFSVEENEQVQKIIHHCAEVLKEWINPTDVLTRVCENGFAVLLYNEREESTIQWAQKARTQICQIASQYKKFVSIDVHVGIYPLETSTSDVDKIILYARKSAQLAALQRMEYMICTPDLQKQFIEEQQLKFDSVRAINKQEFQMYLHFWVDAHTYQIVGAEALSRWNHPQRGILTPAHYVPTMERDGCIDILDYYNLEKVCAFLHRLNNQGVKKFTVSCNFSRYTFGQIDFVSRCKEIVGKYDFPRENLVFELTESVSERAREQVQTNILELRKYGAGIALDDLGNGFASVYDLRDYTVTDLKIPMELTKSAHSVSGKRIIHSVIELGHELGVRVLAEGVENDEELKNMQELGCDIIQGYRFYVPMPEYEAERIVLQEFKETF